MAVYDSGESCGQHLSVSAAFGQCFWRIGTQQFQRLRHDHAGRPNGFRVAGSRKGTRARDLGPRRTAALELHAVKISYLWSTATAYYPPDAVEKLRGLLTQVVRLATGGDRLSRLMT